MVVLVASAALESLRFYSLKASLPLAPGGMLGLELSQVAARYLGYTGATLFILAAMDVGWSVFSSMSWLVA